MKNRELEQPVTTIWSVFIRLPGGRPSLRNSVIAASAFIAQPDLSDERETAGNRKLQQNQAVSIPDSQLPIP